MAVHGVGFWHDERRERVRVVVTADDRMTVRTIRDETLPVLIGDHADDLGWQVDQYTQETIGVTLAAEGWEVFSTSDAADAPLQGAPSGSPVYLVRR